MLTDSLNKSMLVKALNSIDGSAWHQAPERAVFTVLMAASIEAIAAKAPPLVLTLSDVIDKAPCDAEMADIWMLSLSLPMLSIPTWIVIEPVSLPARSRCR